MSGTNTKRRQWRLVLVWVFSAALVACLFVLNFRLLDRIGITPAIQLALLVGVAAGLWATQVFYWRALDEVARAVHLSAFFWSGLVTWTLLPFGMSALLLFDRKMAVLAEVGAFEGAMSVVMVHALLYLLLWGWARFRMR